MPWIEIIPYESSSGALRAAFDRVKGPNGAVDNVLTMHSLRPHTLDGHMALYKSVLHNSANTVPKWFLETLGVWVSALNRCGYCVMHHTRGMRRLLRDDQRAVSIVAAVERRDIQSAPLDSAQKLAMRYAELLTCDPALIDAAIIRQMREAGLDDGQILEINQVCSYFAYVNRTVLGLGCELESESGGGEGGS